MELEPEFKDLVTLLRVSVERHGARPLFGTRGAESWSWLSGQELAREVDRARAGLAALGVGRGDRVAVISGNRVEWAVAAYATFGLGAAWVPMYEAQRDQEIAYILADCGARVCFVASRAIAERVRALDLRPAPSTLEHVVAFEAGAGELDWDALRARGDLQPVAPATPAPDDLATIVYTSGTTGNPKGVELSHANCAWQASALRQLGFARPGEESTVTLLPWAHVAGGVTELHGGICLGASMALCDHPQKLPQYLGEIRPTMLIAVPRIWNKLYQGVQKMISERPGLVQAIFRNGLAASAKRGAGKPSRLVEKLCAPLAEALIFKKIRARFGGRLKFAISGSAALSREVAEFIDAVGIPVYEGYGMTETTSAVTATLPGAQRIGSVGKPMPGVTVKLDRDAPGAEGDVGEIIVYGPGTMRGYRNLPEETQRALTPDGGMRTGDLGRFDADGYLYITGRVKELYKLENGKYIAPAPLEEKITLSRFIQQAVIYGADRPYNVALLVPDMAAVEEWAAAKGAGSGDAPVLARPDVRALFAEELARVSADWKGYERIKKFGFITEPFSPENGLLTPSLKLKRRAVLAKYEGELQALYTGASTTTE